MLAVLKGFQRPHHYAQASTALKPTSGVPFGSTLYETDTHLWYIFTAAGWILESMPPESDVVVHIHTIAITVVNAAAAQTDVITIDGVPCSFTSDATPTTTEISAGLRAAIAASAAAGKFVVTGTTSVILTPAGTADPVVTVSANLADTQTLGTPVLGSVAISSIAAGDNNIGNVDVLTLPGTVQADIAAMKADIALIKAGIPISAELPTGTKNIGDVDVLTLPSVTIGTMAALVAGEAHVGEVGGNTLPVVVTPVIGAAAFHANDIVGAKLTILNAARVAAGTGIWTTLTIVDAAKQATELGVYLFNADLTVAADNAAEATSAADWLKFVGHKIISAGDYRTLANACVASLIVNIPYKVATGTSLFAFIRCTGTPTFTANCLQLTFGLLRD